jgi:hypothetical protein
MSLINPSCSDWTCLITGLALVSMRSDWVASIVLSLEMIRPTRALIRSHSFNHARSVTEPPPRTMTRASNGLC